MNIKKDLKIIDDNLQVLRFIRKTLKDGDIPPSFHDIDSSLNMDMYIVWIERMHNNFGLFISQRDYVFRVLSEDYEKMDIFTVYELLKEYYGCYNLSIVDDICIELYFKI